MMKRLLTLTLVLPLLAFAFDGKKKDYKENFIIGSPEIKSINAMSFGPDGILFIGDSKSASIFAIETTDNGASPDEIKVEGVDSKIAAALGTSVDNMTIQDMAVHPTTKKAYFSVHRNDGTPALLRFNGDQVEAVDLEDIKYSVTSIGNPVAVDAKDSRDRPLRKWAISDINYADDKVMVTGLSNQEFSSTFRSIAFPFAEDEAQSSIEIWHAAHGRYETYAPVKTFTTAEVNGKSHVIASYTCTPLVLFPADQLKPGQHVKGRTVAELGSWNSPLDIITLEKEGEKFLVMSNTNRAVMKIRFSDLEKFEGQLTEPVEENYATEGVYFVNLPIVNALQIDKFTDSKFVVLQRRSNGSLDLWTTSERYL